MVVFQKTDKFYSRNSGGKYRLDVGELRGLFNLSNTVAEQVKKFRIERLSAIMSGETPISIHGQAKIILHLIPLQSFSPPTRISLSLARQNADKLFPLSGSGYGERINLDGLLYHNGNLRGSGATSYLQLFNNGAIEAVDANILEALDKSKIIPGSHLHQKITQHTQRYLLALQNLGLNLPILAMLTLVGVKDYEIAVGWSRQNGVKIDRDVLIIPELFIEKFNILPSDLKPLLDSVWNAGGYLESENFNTQGG